MKNPGFPLPQMTMNTGGRLKVASNKSSRKKDVERLSSFLYFVLVAWAHNQFERGNRKRRIV